MTRFLYRCILGLHPPHFRREFAGEMLWVFDESTGAENPAALLYDALVSLARQWLLRSGSWKIGVALAGAALQIAVGSVGMLVFARPHMETLGSEASLRGVWSGVLESGGVSKPVELVFDHDRGSWLGVFTAAAQTSSVMDFEARTSNIAFRVPAAEGDLHFRGRLMAGKLSGTVQRSGESIGFWQVARPRTADTTNLVQLTVLIVPGVLVAVILLTLWSRRFMLRRANG